MPNNFGGDQLDHDYAPWFEDEVVKHSKRTESFFRRRGLDLGQYNYIVYKTQIDVNRFGQLISIAKLNPRSGLVTLSYNLGNVRQIEDVLDFRRILSEHNISYRPKDIPCEALNVIREQLSEAKRLAQKVGYRPDEHR